MAANQKPVDSTPAFAALHRAGVKFAAHSYVHDPRAESFGMEAAEALGVEPARVFKTLMAVIDGELCVGVVPVMGSLDLKALADALGGKRAQMADAAQAQRATGYVIGGISPVGQKKAHRTVIDRSASQWPTIFVSGGRRGLEAEIAPADLTRITRAVLARIAR
ncbi:Cys-tRNA(Pro) deacylase [Aeromicrobium wangtongii]|uniref:Cys-tRNA(Pro)/Cys-tRNA(Cys) deacylase n=1 Tax=Aeromicrobium wangtongii TaxID=2969247 RepID=A0ABY5MAA7_9ACTN|nr:Cys-tRNA(Pro) deacylase [Aeromicrobium wangtongii]MCD9197573.1 Cys-tRNA(Pro) deacylase [Aeromicrobium wangtongii]MCL3818488.1 Cys-tRNA(Pro) deacylase [Aeromicrobium wangtongii]UUP15065.1 Cys-tRNA(Pro) deacylase [Aeromicrobium wangtongii]